MSRLELWTRTLASPDGGIYLYAVYDIDADRFYWYETLADAQGHYRAGRLPEPISSAGHRESE